MQFSSSFQQAHKRLAPHLPIKRFAAVVNPQSIGLSSAADFYAPVRFSVQASGKANDPTGIICMDVAVQKNPDWLHDMKAQLVETMGLSESNSPVELKTVTGMPLERVPVEQLHNVGKLSVFHSMEKEPIRVAALPPVPAEYRSNKTADLKQWVAQLADTIPQAVAAVLKGKNIYEVEEALRSEGGAVVKEIQRQLDCVSKGRDANNSFPEFVRLHQANSAKCAEPEACKQLQKKVAKQILTYIRTFINAAQDDVLHHIAAEQAQKAVATVGDEHLLKPVFKSSTAAVAKPKLYASLVEDALKVPALQKSLVSTIYNFDSKSFANATAFASTARPLAKRVQSVASHHPWFAHIHHTLLPIRGTYPSDYLTRHTRKDMSARAPFVGDLNKTYDAYHRFSGVHAAPPPLRIKGGVALVECHTSGRHHRRRSSSSDEDVNAALVGASTMGMPKLIPIGSAASGGGKTMPKLIPIGSSASGGGINRPRLIPINADAEDIEANAVPVDEFPHLPSVDDIFK